MELKGINVQLLVRTVLSLKQFPGTVNVKMDNKKLVFSARNALNGRSVQHIFKGYFFSVLDKHDITSELSVNISDIVDSFESIGAMDGESFHCVLEITDNKFIIAIDCQNDHLQISLNPAPVNPVSKPESDLTVVDGKEHHAESNELLDRDESSKSTVQSHCVAGDEDTQEIEDLIRDAEANDLPYHIIKTMKEFKKNKDEVIVID